jgi:hypothetical protein
MPGEESSDTQYERLKHQLQQTILTEYPNPERKGCPGEALLRGLAARYLDESVPEDPNWHHVTHCSPCYQEFLDIRSQAKHAAKTKKVGIAAGLVAAAVVLIGAAFYFTRQPEVSREERPQIAELVYRPRVVDLEGRSMTRSDEGNEETKPIVLGRGREELNIRLPFASKAGTYEVQLLKSADNPLVSASGEAQIVDGTTALKAKVDLSNFEPGKYLLGVRRLPADWTYYPAEIR